MKLYSPLLLALCLLAAAPARSRADWHLLYDPWAGLVNEAIRPRHVLAMHFQLDSGEDHFAKLRKAVPGVVLLRETLATTTFQK